MSAVDEAIARLAAKERGELRDGHYDDRRTTGFVVRQETTFKSGTTHVSWWYGDDDGTSLRYWNAWGDLDYSVAWFDTKVKAKLALRRCGLLSRARIVPIMEAKAELADACDERAAVLMARARMLRG